MVMGLIIPRLTLTNYGSETNGYMSLVNQIYAYIALLEAGMANTALQALYAPVVADDKQEISGILSAAKKYYNKIACYYSLVVLVVSAVLPFVIQTELSKSEMAMYFLLFGVSNIINFWSVAAWRPLLLAEGKNYVNNNITMIFHIGSQLIKIALLSVGVNIVVLQTGYCIVNTLQIVMYYIYFKKKYAWIDTTVKPLWNKLSQRSAFFLQQVSNLVFSCVDVVVLSVFCDLKVASVYAVYMLIFNALSTILSTLTSSTQFILGQSYNEDKSKYVFVHRSYEKLLLIVAFSMFTTAYLLTIPFIRLYTAGVTDIDYVDSILPFMFCMNGLLATCKTVPLNLINISFHAKNTLHKSIIEAAINLVLSLVLVQFFDIKGVLFATGIALWWRVIDLLFYANHTILRKSLKPTLKLYMTNFLIFGALVAVRKFISFSISGYGDFFVNGAICFIIVFAVFLLLNYVFDIRDSNRLIEIILVRKRKIK